MRVLGLGDDATLVLGLTVALALILHVGAAARAWLIPLELLDWNRHLSAEIGDRLTETYEIEQEKAKPPEPPAPPAPEPDPVAPPEPAQQRPEQVDPSPPMAAQAGAVLTAPENPDDPVDLTGSFVSGTGDSYAGGVTQTGGTSKAAVYNKGATNQGIAGGTGTKPAPAQVGPDQSRGIQLAGSSEWRCPFPAEADADNVDNEYATVSVVVGIDGRPMSASIVSDPGHGFGREARACALRERFLPALSRDGTPLQATKSFKIHFER